MYSNQSPQRPRSSPQVLCVFEHHFRFKIERALSIFLSNLCSHTVRLRRQRRHRCVRQPQRRSGWPWGHRLSSRHRPSQVSPPAAQYKNQGSTASALTVRACVWQAQPQRQARPMSLLRLIYLNTQRARPARLGTGHAGPTCLVLCSSSQCESIVSVHTFFLWPVGCHFSVLQVGAYHCVFWSLFAGFHVCVWRWVPVFSV